MENIKTQLVKIEYVEPQIEYFKNENLDDNEGIPQQDLYSKTIITNKP